MKILVDYFELESAWSALKAVEYHNPAQTKNFQDALDILTKILLANPNPDSTDCRLDRDDPINFIGLEDSINQQVRDSAWEGMAQSGEDCDLYPSSYEITMALVRQKQWTMDILEMIINASDLDNSQSIIEIATDTLVKAKALKAKMVARNV